VTFAELLDRAEKRFGAGAVLDLSRDVVVSLTCPSCGAATAPAGRVLGGVRERDAACPACGAHRIVDVTASVTRGGAMDLSWTPAQVGLPPFDLIVARRGLDAQEGWLFDGDAPRVLGELHP